ncbi:MAG: MgtC/SapB family protein, partial [Acidimicrobiia bacterium]
LKNRGTVRGLTTAATLFLSAGLGIAVGAGVIIPAVMTTVLALVLMFGLSALKPLIRSRGARVVHVEYERGHGTMGPLLRSLQDIGGTIDDLQIDDNAGTAGDPLRHVLIRMVTGDRTELEQVLDEMRQRPEIRTAWVSES